MHHLPLCDAGRGFSFVDAKVLSFHVPAWCLSLCCWRPAPTRTRTRTRTRTGRCEAHVRKRRAGCTRKLVNNRVDTDVSARRCVPRPRRACSYSALLRSRTEYERHRARTHARQLAQRTLCRCLAVVRPVFDEPKRLAAAGAREREKKGPPRDEACCLSSSSFRSLPPLEPPEPPGRRRRASHRDTTWPSPPPLPCLPALEASLHASRLRFNARRCRGSSPSVLSDWGRPCLHIGVRRVDERGGAGWLERPPQPCA